MRFRLRMGQSVSPEEHHDWLDALHNIPELLNDYGSGGGWFVEENVDWALDLYDKRWLSQPGSEQRMSLVKTLEQARNGDFEPPAKGSGS